MRPLGGCSSDIVITFWVENQTSPSLQLVRIREHQSQRALRALPLVTDGKPVAWEESNLHKS